MGPANPNLNGILAYTLKEVFVITDQYYRLSIVLQHIPYMRIL